MDQAQGLFISGTCSKKIPEEIPNLESFQMQWHFKKQLGNTLKIAEAQLLHRLLFLRCP